MLATQRSGAGRWRTFGFLHFRGGRGIPHEQMEEALALERMLPQGPLAWRRDECRSRSSSSGRVSSIVPGDLLEDGAKL